MTFTITREQHGTTVWIYVSGELDLSTSPQLREAWANERRNGGGVVLIDLAQVTYIDSGGLHALIDACRQDQNERLRIMLGPAAAHGIDITNLRHSLPIIEG